MFKTLNCLIGVTNSDNLILLNFQIPWLVYLSFLANKIAIYQNYSAKFRLLTKNITFGHNLYFKNFLKENNHNRKILFRNILLEPMKMANGVYRNM